MNYKDLDLTYYAKVTIRTKKNYKTIIYMFTIPKKLLTFDKDYKPLPYYRIGNWKTKEIFGYGKSTKINDSLSKGIPKALINKLPLDKDDILCIRLEGDIIWIEKIDKPTINICKFKFNLTKSGKYKNRLLIPSICRKILLLNSQTNNMTLDFLGIINNNSKLKNYSRGSHKTCIDFSTKLINQLDLKEKELYCLLEKNKLTIIEEKENEKVGKI